MELKIRRGTLDDAGRFIRFLNEVKAEMPQKEWFYLDPPEWIRKMLAEGTMTLWLAEDGDRIVAAFDILQPGLDSCNYGYDLELDREELMQVVHMDTAAVHRDYRGLGLQRKLVETAEKQLSGKGSRILLTTVHPDNFYSLNNMRRQGYRIQKRVEKYQSERYVLRKDIF